MATKKQVEELAQLFAEARPDQMNAMAGQRQWSTGSDGMLGVLIYLYRAGDLVTAGMISRVMHITTGRVSVLIKKMADKGLITRETGREDARVTEVRLTDKGRKVVETMEAERTAQMKKLIDTIGMDRLKAYIETSREVWSILTPLSIDI